MHVLVRLVIGLPAALLVLRVVLGILSRFHKHPCPCFFAAAILDNPLRHRLQPPAETARRHGLQPGMTALEVGPGGGTYTIAAAHLLGPSGRMVAVDIQAAVTERLKDRTLRENVTNLETRVADVHALPYADGYFDAVYMMAVIGEIPDPQGAIREFYRVLKPGGTVAFTEVLPDPDYPRRRTLTRWATEAGFRLKDSIGSFLFYTLVFRKVARTSAA